MKKPDLNEVQRKAYWDLFVNRYDTYTRQLNNGEFSRIDQPLTPEILFNKDENIGAYQLNKDNEVKWAVLDIDLVKKVHSSSDFDINIWLPKLQEQTKNAYFLLKAKGIESMIEFSGFKGYHLWLFFGNLIDAKLVEKFMHDIFDSMHPVDEAIEWEIFPKQGRLGVDDEGNVKGWGNFVKFPLQLHKKSGNYSYFVDTDFNKIEIDFTIVPKVDLSQIKLQITTKLEHKNSVEKLKTVNIQPTNLKNIFDNCAKLAEIRQKAIDDELNETQGHKLRLALASVLKPFGNEGYTELINILSHVSDFNEKKTGEQWDSINQPPHLCETICGIERCDNILKAGGTSPIKFGYEKYNGIPIKFSEKNSCYFKHEKKGKQFIEKQVSTFTINPKELLVLEDSDCLKCDVRSSMGYSYKNVLLENVDWHTRSKFLKALGHQDCTFTGSENDLQALCSYVNTKVPIRKTGTKKIGLIDNIWVSEGFNITKEGIQEELKIVPFEKGSNAFYHKIKYKSLSDVEYKNMLTAFYENIGKVNEPEVIYPLISWIFTTPLKTIIGEKLDGYPLVFIHGSQGSGKTTTGQLMLRLVGYCDSQPNSCTMRPFPMLKLLSANNGIPILLDEFKVSDMRSDQVDSLLRYMRKSYKGEFEQKGRADQTIEEYQLIAPMIVMGEWNINQPAIKERLILIRFTEKVKKSRAMQIVYEKLKSIELEGFMPKYIEFCLKQDIDTLIDEAREIVEKQFQSISVAPRIRNNLTTMILGLMLFRKYANKHNISTNMPDIKELLNSQLKNITGSNNGNVKSAVDQLIEEFGVMAMNQKITLDVDYTFANVKKKEILAIQFKKIFPQFKEYAQRTNYEGELLDKDSYLLLFSDCKYIVGNNINVKFGKKAKRCLVLDISATKKAGIDLDVFENELE